VSRWLQTELVPRSHIYYTLKREAIRTSETSVNTISIRRHIPEGGIFHSHRRENLKSYTWFLGSTTTRSMDGCPFLCVRVSGRHEVGLTHIRGDPAKCLEEDLRIQQLIVNWNRLDGRVHKS
jgi:hypothetical protein